MRLTSDAKDVCKIPVPSEVLSTEERHLTLSKQTKYALLRLTVRIEWKIQCAIRAKAVAGACLLSFRIANAPVNDPSCFCLGTGIGMQLPSATAVGSSGSQSLSASHRIANGDVILVASIFVT